ncbi:hypothetical protein A3A67_04025 [Candidatus Peribacteria bacterium RIFCSPLOWO2_01_FULL_51_18]|nr:MAG: hypothetical protein A3C52_05405 [Candidatus Peribacteria bacterium RIFCSPHIGHO2_02_FULL_51_15]OGJ66792.1 MAG: hypothetical protein A3A67_04025 [Candidatus Peribacteria bacterium RIFCSPLOWO2_01_FULL_51_18]
MLLSREEKYSLLLKKSAPDEGWCSLHLKKIADSGECECIHISIPVIIDVRTNTEEGNCCTALRKPYPRVLIWSQAGMDHR